MEIKEKVEIEAENKTLVDAVIDTGADISVFNEETLLAIGAKHTFNTEMLTVGETLGTKPVYGIKSMKIRNCKVPIFFVIGGRKNLIGHDVLQKMKARIDEGTGTIEFPESNRNYVEV